MAAPNIVNVATITGITTFRVGISTVGASAGITTIVAKKQALRDAPAASGIATAANTTELKAQWDTSILGDSPYS